MSTPAITCAPVETERLTVRPLNPSDRDAYLAMMRESMEYHRPWAPRLPPEQTLEQFWTSQIARAQQGIADGSGFRGVGILKASGELVGTFNLNNICRGVFQNTDAGWMMHARHAGKGLATEGVTALLDLAFSPFPLGVALHRVQANVIPTNLASLRVCEKCGFRREGIGKQLLEIDGRWQDHVMHAKLADEHQQRYIKT